MKYADRDGNVYEKASGQDKLLKFLYGHTIGRLLLKPLVLPAVSKAGGMLLSTRFSTRFIRPFVNKNHIDMSQYESQDYTSYNDFFTRRIRKEFRPVAGGETVLISPCDSKLSIYPINDASIFYIKHTGYTLKELLKSKKLADKYKGGYACIFRLTVDDYHRYCYVDNGIKSENICIPGVFHTVNPAANDVLPVYKENTREYSLLKSEHFKTVLMMEVGALLVGKITNYHGLGPVKRGQEKGRFEFGGSTVILLFQKEAVRFDKQLIENTGKGCETVVKMGECLGTKYR